MRIPRSRGAVSGLLLMILGAWGALVPFIGPYFDLVIGPDDAWNWSMDRFWLSVLPGVVAFAGGLLLLMSAHRGGAGIGAWMGIAAGAWFALGPLLSRLWTDDGASALGRPAGGTNRQVVELLTMYTGLGVLMAAVAAFALGRLAVRSVRDVELAEAAELEAARARERERAPAGAGDRDRVSDDDERFRRQPETAPAPARRPVAAGSPPAATTPTSTPAEPATTEHRGGGDRVAEPSASAQTEQTRVIPPETAPPRRSGGLLGRLRRG